MSTDNKVARVHLDLVEGLKFTASFPSHPDMPPLTIDEEPPLGTDAGPNPAAMLASAVGGCLAASLMFCLRKARITTGNLSADVAATITRNAAGRFRVAGIDVGVSLEINSEDDARVTRCHEIFEDFCIVTESVRQGIPVDVRVSTHRTESLVEG